MSKKNEYVEFVAPIRKRDFGRMFYTVVFVPRGIEKELNLKMHPRLRLTGSIAGVPFSGAVQPNGGNWYLILSKKLLKGSDSSMGDTVTVKLQVADQDAVDVPEDLLKEIQRRPDLQATWESLSPGKKRGLAYRVSSAKLSETRERRILEVIEVVMDEQWKDQD